MPPGDSRENPRDRPTSRVILLDPAGRTLLFTVEEPDEETGKRFWFAPGGGLEPGETHEQAAARELLEETGIEAPIGPCVWLRAHTWFFAPRNAWYRSVERYFLGYVETPEVRKDRWTDLEIQLLSGVRWWSVAEMLASDDVFTPRRLPELLPGVLAGLLPAEPIEVGI